MASMEKGRRRFGSGIVSTERKNQLEPAPLAISFSFNDRDVHPHCPNAQNPYHKCYRHCLDEIPSEMNKHFDAISAERKGGKRTKMAGRKEKDRNCLYYSNPYHKCAEYCFEETSVEVQEFVQNKGLKKMQKKGLTPTSFNAMSSFNKYAGNLFCINPVGHLDSSKVIPDIKDRSSVDPKCKYASNPYHKCAEYCFEDIPEKDRIVRDFMKSREKNKVVLPGERKVNPECQFSTDPCHFCTEYCFQVVTEVERHRHVTKSKVSKELPAELKGNHLHMEKICVESCYTGALNADSIVKSYEGLILQEKTKKNSMNFNVVELSSPDYNNYVKFSKRITSVDGNAVLHSNKEVEMKNPKQYSDVQPSHIDASNFFIEWAKYCSQETRDKKVEGGECATKNDKEDANFNYCDSTKFQKDKAEGSLQVFLPTSLLFFVGFLFTLFYWTQMFHPVISERKKSAETMAHRGLVEPKVKRIM